MTILEALEHIYMGDIYDDKGYLTEKGYLTLQTLEGVQLTEYGEELLKKIVIPLAPITKKNSQKIHINHRTGRRYIAPSDTFTIYQNKCLEYLYPFINNAEHFNYPVNVKCLFYMPTRRRVDLTNLLEAIDDILTHYRVIEDDDAQHVGGHDGSRVLYDKDNPRTEIVITTLDGGRCSEVKGVEKKVN